MSPLRVEAYISETDSWNLVGDVNWGDPDASMSSNNSDGSRDVFLFGVDIIKRIGFIKRSIAGLDEATPDTRIIDSAGFETVATLEDNESFEIETVTDRSNNQRRRVRFTYLQDQT